jgi:Bcr/CflA subfamily drug resistance transporter
MHYNNQQRFFPWTLVIYEILVYLSMDAYIPALTQLKTDFHTTSNLVQLTVSVWMLGAFAAQLIIGPLTDRYGRRPILLTGGVIYVLSSLGCGLSTNIHTMLVMRLMQGMTMPTMYIAGYAAINEMFNSQSAIKILARMKSVTIIAPAFGPLIGGFLLLYVDWPWIFYILAILSSVAIVVLYFLMPETLDAKSEKASVPMVFQQYLSVLKNKKFMVMCFINFMPMIGLIAWMMVASLLIIGRFHYTTVEFGLIQALIFAFYVVGARITSRLIDTIRNSILINSGLAIMTVSAIITIVISTMTADELWGMVFAIALLSMSIGMIAPILTRGALDSSDMPMGIRVTVFSVIRIGSGVVGSVAMAIFYNGHFLSMSILIAITAVLALALNFFLRRESILKT